MVPANTPFLFVVCFFPHSRLTPPRQSVLSSLPLIIHLRLLAALPPSLPRLTSAQDHYAPRRPVSTLTFCVIRKSSQVGEKSPRPVCRIDPASTFSSSFNLGWMGLSPSVLSFCAPLKYQVQALLKSKALHAARVLSLSAVVFIFFSLLEVVLLVHC